MPSISGAPTPSATGGAAATPAASGAFKHLLIYLTFILIINSIYLMPPLFSSAYSVIRNRI